jgi:DNA-binding transcriptional regulator YhcF (GntR family)
VNINENPELLKDYFMEKIISGEMSAGSRLPSIRKMMKDFKTSPGVARKTLDLLSKAGVVVKNHGSGTYVRKIKETHSGKRTNIAVFVGAEQDTDAFMKSGIYSSALLGVQKAAQSADVGLFLNFNFSRMADAQINDVYSMVSGAILFGLEEYGEEYRNINPGIPIVGVCFNDTYCGKISAVDMDPFQAAEISCRYFSEKKTDNVVIVSHGRPPYINRGRIFSEHWSSSGHKSSFLMFPDELIPEQGTGYLFTSGHIAEFYIRKNSNVKNTVLLSYDGKSKYQPEFYRHPAVWVDWVSLGEAAFEECYKRITSPGTIPKRIYFPGKMIFDRNIEKNQGRGGLK